MIATILYVTAFAGIAAIIIGVGIYAISTREKPMRVHVTPTNDTITHTNNRTCACNPAQDGDVVIHNAADGR